MDQTEQLMADLQEAVDRWTADLDHLGSFKSMSIPLDALPYLKQIWSERNG